VGLTTRRLDGTVIAAFAYEVDAVGLWTGMTATYGWRNPLVVVERYTYDPLRRLTGVTDSEGFRETYGRLIPAQGDFTDLHNPYTFLGKEWDEGLGLYEFGVRLYDPWAGVWLTREPLPGDVWRPRTWHRYAYAFASPISYDDPYGMQTCGFNILTGEQECFGETTGMGWTPTFAWTPLSSSVPAAPPPAGAWMCLLSPADLFSLAYGGYQAWRAGRMLRGGLRFVPGSAYPGPIIVYGSREACEAVGLSPFLTHARWTHPALIRFQKTGKPCSS